MSIIRERIDTAVRWQESGERNAAFLPLTLPGNKRMKKYEKADIQRAYICGKYAVRTVFWSGESDLSRVYGTDGGQQYVAGGGRIPDHGSRAAASWRSCPGDQPGGRAPGTEQQGGQKVRTVLYLHAVSDDRPFFAIPRCATVSYTVGIERILPGTGRASGSPCFLSCFLLQCSSSPFARGRS